MIKSNLIESINQQASELIQIVENDISDLSVASDDRKKFKKLKYLIDSLHKITSTILQIKKLENSGEYQACEDLENDKKILFEYLQKIKGIK